MASILVFLMFWEMELSYIFPKQVFIIFQEIEIFSFGLKFFPEKDCLYFFLKDNFKKLSYIFSKRSFSYILGNETF